MSAKFKLGKIVSTPAALEAIEKSNQTPEEFLSRHQQGDWGDVSQFDSQANDVAVEEDLRVFSVYYTTNADKLYVITEWDRSATTILTPDDY